MSNYDSRCSRRHMPLRARLSAVALAAFVGIVAPAAALAQSRGAAEDSAQAIHLLSRATFGIRPGDVAAVLTTGRDAWLERQLHPDRIRDTLGQVLDGRYPATSAPMAQLYRDYAPPPRPKAGVRDSMMSGVDAAPVEKQRPPKGKAPQAILLDLSAAKLERAALSDRQLEEVMTDFWFNHFNVFFQKGADRYLVGDYERNAIRPHVFDKFEDLLIATAQHPAMLFYLDNWQSVHVDSMARARLVRRLPPQSQMQQQAQPRKTRGLNENYARELLELHTLGVDGGYTQKDVVDVARALTGWTFTQPRGAFSGAGQFGAAAQFGSDDVSFMFRAQLHDRGEKTVLGHHLKAGRGIEDGRDVLHIVATHSATAHFIATKLVEYFVTDNPPVPLVEHLAEVFRKSGGDLREVTRALFTDAQFYAPANRHAKTKTPFQLVASAFRATDAQMMNPRGVLTTLRALGQLPYMSTPPTGYPAMSADWVNSGALLARMNFGIDYAAGKVPGVYPDGRTLFAGVAPGANGLAALHATTAALLPGIDASKLESAIIADMQSRADSLTNPRAKAARMIGLVLGSPEFQQH